jgi:hypothetical protein
LFLNIKKKTSFFLIMDNTNAVSNLHVLGAIGQAARDGAAAQCADTTTILQGQAGTTLANMANTERLGLNVTDNIYRASLANREAIERNADWTKDSVERNGTAIALAVERNGAGSILATERTTNEVTNLIARTTGEIKNTQQAIASETRQGINENHVAILANSKDILINDNQNTGKILLQASSNFGRTELDIGGVKSKLEIQAAQNVAQIQLEALKNKNSISAQLAECCCELKHIVQSSAQTTQQVLQEIENNRIRDALAAINTENLISKLGHH